MRLTRLHKTLLVVLISTASYAQESPLNDYHQHLLSPSVAKLIGEQRAFDADDLIAQMDAAGIQHSLILSLAYQFGNPHRPPVPDEYAKVKAENDWTASQIKAHPTRLFGACGVDPLKDYALAEIDRCSHNPYLRSALKLHFGNSDVDLDNPDHVDRLRRVFAAADGHRMTIVVHMHANINFHRPYGRREAEVFLAQILPMAPRSIVQVGHLAGSGGFDDPSALDALNVFLAAIRRNDKRVSHLYFDISGVAGLGEWESKKKDIASTIQSIGLNRILYGSDGAWTDFTIPKAVAAYRSLPLTEQEFHVIDRNAPFGPWRR
jgi:predicted TIM-barrel fold metal-dependent hydrolase